MRYQETDLAWAAGFLEGEGSFILNVRRGGRNTLAVVRASQVDKSPLLKLQRLFGGSICFRAGKGNRSDIWVWSASTSFCAGALELIIPYMTGTKQKQARFVMKYAQRCQMNRQSGIKVSDAELRYRNAAHAKLISMRAA